MFRRNVSSSIGKDTLTMIASPDYPPYKYYDIKGSETQIVGFDVDIANAIAKQLRFKLKVMESEAIVTHEMGFARVVASRIMFLDQGRLAEDTTPSEFFSNPKCDRAKQFLEKML